MLNYRINKRISRLAGFGLALAVLLCSLSATPVMGDEKPALQALVVTTKDWSSVDATLRLYERKDAKSAWISVGEMIPAVVGRTGLAFLSSPCRTSGIYGRLPFLPASCRLCRTGRHTARPCGGPTARRSCPWFRRRRGTRRRSCGRSWRRRRCHAVPRGDGSA